MSNITDSTKRFSSRVKNYIKYRPHYPSKIINYLKKEKVLKPNSVIADIGSGTGISSELFLNNGNTVYGVEPNKEMLEAGEKYLSKYKRFISVNGTAGSTTLNNSCVDIVTAGQAFHWFDVKKAKREFKRILKNSGFVVLMWNIRKSKSSPLMKEYEKLLQKFGTDYKEFMHLNVGEKEYKKLLGENYKTKNFDNEQRFDFEGLKGRILSSSYVPDEFQPNYEPMVEEMKKIFDKHNKNGMVTIIYISEVIWGKIK